MNKAEFDKLQKKLAREKWEIHFGDQLSKSDSKVYWFREYKWHPIRKWRADYLIVIDGMPLPANLEDITYEYKQKHFILVEIEGGTWSRGRHTRGSGFSKDCEKYNTAAALGWRVFRFPAGMVEDGSAIKFLEEEVFCQQ